MSRYQPSIDKLTMQLSEDLKVFEGEEIIPQILHMYLLAAHKLGKDSATHTVGLGGYESGWWETMNGDQNYVTNAIRDAQAGEFEEMYRIGPEQAKISYDVQADKLFEEFDLLCQEDNRKKQVEELDTTYEDPFDEAFYYSNKYTRGEE